MAPRRIAPLVTFRLLFGGLMATGAFRFMASGWIERLYGEPGFFFKFYGFEWVSALSITGMYWVYGIMGLSALGIMLGLFYRWSALVFWLSFTYTELIDMTNYLNHYYLVCLLGFMLIFLPAHRRFSLDVWRKPSLRVEKVPGWCIYIIMLQVGLVYFFAGLAKLNPDWLLRAMPLAMWLPTKADWPLIGPLFAQTWGAYAFSWTGALYDLTIPFLLLNRRTRPVAYLAVIVFHVLTKLLFNIGLFPFIMIFNTLIFFPAATHEKWLGKLGYGKGLPDRYLVFPKRQMSLFRTGLLFFFALQLLLPLRHLCYPGNVLWTEEGYRFAWRVMLVEKAGQATFTVRDPQTGRQSEVNNSGFLTAYQEKQMAIQPDLILQYAHHLAEVYQRQYRIPNPEVTVDCFVAINGRSSRRLIDPDLNLADIEDSLLPKSWILPFENDDKISQR
jgi:hypothetical protein